MAQHPIVIYTSNRDATTAIVVVVPDLDAMDNGGALPYMEVTTLSEHPQGSYVSKKGKVSHAHLVDMLRPLALDERGQLRRVTGHTTLLCIEKRVRPASCNWKTSFRLLMPHTPSGAEAATTVKALFELVRPTPPSPPMPMPPPPLSTKKHASLASTTTDMAASPTKKMKKLAIVDDDVFHSTPDIDQRLEHLFDDAGLRHVFTSTFCRT